jgi:hypothetical protein
MIDSGSTKIVPATVLVDLTHPSLSYPATAVPWAKTGSLQEYIDNKGSCEDYSSSLFPKFEVQKVALLDLRLLNMDRNEGNLLVTKSGHYALVPIDHGMTFPDCFDISVEDLCWFSWPQVREPICQELMSIIEQIDPVKDICMLKRLFPFRDNCLKNFRIAAVLLKKGARAGLTLHQIASLLYRQNFDDAVSAVERTVEKAEEFYLIAKQSKTSEPVKPKAQSKAQRPRAHSENELELGFPCAVPSPPTLDIKGSEALITIEEESDEETESTSDEQPMRLHRRTSSMGVKPTPMLCSDLALDEQFFAVVEAFLEQLVGSTLRENKGRASGYRLRSYSSANEL